MASLNLESVALTLVEEGKGILAADETIPTLTRRFDTLGIQSTEKSRRTGFLQAGHLVNSCAVIGRRSVNLPPHTLQSPSHNSYS